MKIITLYCDRCGKEFKPDPIFMTWQYHIRKTATREDPNPEHLEEYEIDLCPSCYRKLYMFMNSYSESEKEI